MRPFAILIWVGLLGILLESGYVLHSAHPSDASDMQSFLQLYRIGVVIYDILWGVGIIQLIQYVLREISSEDII